MSEGAVNPNSPYHQASPTTPWGMLYEFLKGQPFNNVLTLCLLGGIVAIGYGLYLSIPKHLSQIQEGYSKIEVVHERVATAQLEEHKAAVSTLAAALKEDRELERKHQREMIDLIIQNKIGFSSPVKE